MASTILVNCPLELVRYAKLCPRGVVMMSGVSAETGGDRFPAAASVPGARGRAAPAAVALALLNRIMEVSGNWMDL